MWGKANARGLSRTTDREGALQSERTGCTNMGCALPVHKGGT